MKRKCAWCGKDLDQAQGDDSLQVTHGVCRECRQRLFGAPRGQGADKPEASGGPGGAETGPGEG
jgi:DNA-directed RNA polymerase subunit RPC12/RpoP